MKLTPRQTEVLQLIHDHIEDNGFPPTRAEITEAFGFRSVNATTDHLKALEAKGAIKLIPGISRGIRLSENFSAQPALPLIGRVAAGAPILAEEHIEEYCAIDPSMFHPKAHFLLRVQGTSMKDIGILNNDLLAVHKISQAPKNGQIVVARLENEVTVKRFRRKGYQVRLLAENPDVSAIHVDLRDQELNIEGLVVGVIRKMKGKV